MSSSAPWSVKAMAQAMGATCVGPLPETVSGLSIDSRTIGGGDAFFAIQGDARDGHDFVPAALLVVADVLAGLIELARAARARTAAKIIAVTGSVGKTGTKEALRLGLAKSGATHASIASYNNHWGVPLSVARMP